MAEKSFFNRTKIIALVLVGAVMTLGAWAWWEFFGRPKPTTELTFYEMLLALPDHSRARVRINERTYTLEVVNTAASVQQGLSDRTEIGADGMLFVMPTKALHSFWMPRMNFPLDILWLDEDVITQVTADVPAPPVETQLWQLPLYTSEKPANLVLELPAGRAALMNITAGDKIELLN